MKNKYTWLGFPITITIILFVILILELSVKLVQTKQSILDSVCREYGDEWSEWKCCFLTGIKSKKNPDIHEFMWMRECKFCKTNEIKTSWSDKTPNATLEMVIVANDEAEKVLEKVNKLLEGKQDKYKYVQKPLPPWGESFLAKIPTNNWIVYDINSQ